MPVYRLSGYGGNLSIKHFSHISHFSKTLQSIQPYKFPELLGKNQGWPGAKLVPMRPAGQAWEGPGAYMGPFTTGLVVWY